MKNNSKTSPVPLELLAPARDLVAGCLAIDNGADAVYIGSPRFGARQAAGNSWLDIKKLVDYAHFFGARVYIVLNTIFFDEEVSAMQFALDQAKVVGADAIIIQDPGIFGLRLPELPIFISTQAHNISTEQVLFWEKIACQRVILGRELSVAEIKKIRAHTKIDLEVFVHGSLCVSYSGRCYLSQQLSGRSANRGACAQPCRLPFRLLDAEGKLLGGEEKNWLCLRDLNASGYLSELVAAGVTSFKIEGRLKDNTYVANTTASYRLLLDKIIAQSAHRYCRASYGRVDLSYAPDLNKSFNRAYSDYFLSGQRRQNLAFGPASLGEEIGRIKSMDKGAYQIDGQHHLNTGDGLVFVRQEKIIAGAYVNQSGINLKFNKSLHLKIGDLVFRNENPSFDKLVAQGTKRLVATEWLLEFKNDSLNIRVTAENGARAELIVNGRWPQALNIKVAENNLRKQLAKLSQNNFYLSDLKIKGDVPFVPLSLINEWRRLVVDKLLISSALSFRPLPKIKISDADQPYPEKILDYRYNIANTYARQFYERHGAIVEEEAMEKSGLTINRPLMTTKHCLRSVLGACQRQNPTVKLAEPLYLETQGRRYRLRFDCRRCVMELISAD